MKQLYKVSSPLKVYYGKKVLRAFSLNLNVYRNYNRFKLGTVKKNYYQIMKPQIEHLPKFRKLKLEYVLYAGSRHKQDLMNICSITDKFFCDCLVIDRKIKDDDYTIIPEIKFRFGGIDKNNPRVDIFLKEDS